MMLMFFSGFINAYASPYTLLPAAMKLKTQIKIYQKLVSELGGKYDGAEDFINSRVKELCCISAFQVE